MCVDEEEAARRPTDAENMVKAQRSQPVKCRKPRQEKGLKEKGGGLKQRKEKKNELGGKRGKESKESHRRRKKTLSLGSGESLDCCVLLTRLEEKGVVVERAGVSKCGQRESEKVKKKPQAESGLQKASTAHRRKPEPKPKRRDTFSLPAPVPAPEPRRRRMASLNAEAVNSLLLYRDEALPSNLPKKRQVSGQAPAGAGLHTPAQERQEAKEGPSAEKVGPKGSAKRQKRAAAEPQDIDWLAIFTPTPRRQAGLTAATLLKLSSLSYGSKRPKKESQPASAAPSTAQGESSILFASGKTAAAKRGTQRKHEGQLKHRQQGEDAPVHSKMDATINGCCNLCKSEAVDPDWTNSGGGEKLLKPGLRCSSLLGFSLKTIKEEQVETDVSSCYCCTQERCVKYCHRLALFLEDKPFKEAEDGSLSEVFHHHHHHPLPSRRPVPPPSSITLSPHTYACLPGYYVHFGRTDSARSPISPLTLCPGGGKGAKLLPSASPQPSGITHPVYCCTSVEMCYGEPCRISSFSSYIRSSSSVIPASGPADYTKCNHGTKRGKQQAGRP